MSPPNSFLLYLNGGRDAHLVLACDVRLELPQDDGDVSLCCQVGHDLQLQDLDVRGVDAPDEEVLEVGLEHAVPAVASTRPLL